MKFKLTLASASLALLMANSSWAQDLAYYKIEEISEKADGAKYGPFPVAMSEDGEFIATYSMKASLSTNIDIGLPFTFNRECQYDDVICEFEFEGSETAGDASYENAYLAWRNAQANASSGYESYMFANTLMTDGADETELPFSGANDSDVKVTDVTDPIDVDSFSSERFIVGYASAPYVNGERDYVRRAYIRPQSGGEAIELIPEFVGEGDKYTGGFSSAYKVQQLTDDNGETKTLVIGAASRSYPRNNMDYFNDCYNSDADQNDGGERYSLNDLVRCPGFDTQAWAWDITDINNITSAPLATTWLENNETNQNSLTFSANAFDMNSDGIAVGTSTFQYGSGDQGARQRAIIMKPDAEGTYTKPEQLTAVNNDIKDQDDTIYNTWALTISDAGIVTGNREYRYEKGRNRPTEFFVYNNETGGIKIPLKDKKVATTKQYLENGSQFVGKSGANSRIYDANEDGLMVGEVDDYDQTDPVYQGSPRSQTAFLFDNNSDQAWLINDLICSQSEADGVVTVTSPRYRIRSARVIGDTDANGEHVILAEGFKYDNDEDYRNRTKAEAVAFKLTRNTEVLLPKDSPNCWESDLLQYTDEPYERQGAATFWLWLFALPLVFMRRFKR